MITAKPIPTALISILTVLGVVSCGTDENDVDYTSGRTVAEARDNLVDTVNSLIPPTVELTFPSEPKQKGCEGAFSANHGPPYKWTYIATLGYSADKAEYARDQANSMRAEGWDVDIDTRRSREQTIRLADDDGVNISVTIPIANESTGTPTVENRISYGGTSECVDG